MAVNKFKRLKVWIEYDNGHELRTSRPYLIDVPIERGFSLGDITRLLLSVQIASGSEYGTWRILSVSDLGAS